MVLSHVIVGAILKGEPEGVRASPIIVVHHLSVRSLLEADETAALLVDDPFAVRRDGYELELAVLHPHSNVLPVVAVTATDVGEVGLKVIVVHVRAPAVVALGPDVNVGLAETVLIAAIAEDPSVVEVRVVPIVERTIARDGDGVVAAVGVVFEGWAPLLLIVGG